MQFSRSAIIAALIAIASSAPTSLPQSTNLQARGIISYCLDSTFENQTSDASPLVADCQQIVRNIANGGSWGWGGSVIGFGRRTFVSHGTCAFSGEVEFSITIGNQDIIDIINDSIAKFQYNGQVGSKGKMLCRVKDSETKFGLPVTWGLYSTCDPEKQACFNFGIFPPTKRTA